MGVVLKWRTPDLTEATYDKVYIHRATSEDGTYLEIDNQLASDNTYFDYEGNSSNWYKIRFYQTSTAAWSNWSGVIQGGTFVGICTPDDIRKIADISTSEMTDTQLWDIIQFSQTMFNKEINSKIIEERVVGLDAIRTNKIDGSNTEFYVQMSDGWFIGDMNGNGEVTPDDVIMWSYDYTNNTKTKLTITAVDPELGKVTVEIAPNNVTLKQTYSYCPVNVNTPDPIAKMACTYLASAIAFTRMDAKCFNKMAIGKLSLAKSDKSFKTYYDEYRNLLNLIKTRMLRRTSDKDLLIYP